MAFLTSSNLAPERQDSLKEKQEQDEEHEHGGQTEGAGHVVQGEPSSENSDRKGGKAEMLDRPIVVERFHDDQAGSSHDSGRAKGKATRKKMDFGLYPRVWAASISCPPAWRRMPWQEGERADKERKP